MNVFYLFYLSILVVIIMMFVFLLGVSGGMEFFFSLLLIGKMFSV